jgi:micrococcal nuclease
MYDYNCTIEQVLDGDTLKLQLDLGFHLWLHVTVRLARVNAPELLAIGGAQAKAFVLSELADAVAFKVSTHRQEKYGRWLGEFFYQQKAAVGVWVNLSDRLLETKNAVRYHF